LASTSSAYESYTTCSATFINVNYRSTTVVFEYTAVTNTNMCFTRFKKT